MIETWIQSKINLSDAAALAIPNQHGIVDITPRTIDLMARNATRLIRHIGDIEINTISPNHIANWQQYEISRPITPNTANSYLNAIKMMFTRLQKNGTIGTNPAAPIKRWPEPTPTPKSISVEHYQTILSTVADIRNRAIIATFWATGCRLGGLLSMRMDKIQPSKTRTGQPRFALYVIEKGKHGKGKPRWVYTKGNEARLLQSWIAIRPPARTPSLFTINITNKPRPLTQTAVHGMFSKIKKRNPEVRHCHPHAFRHAFAINSLNSGLDLALVSQLMGHHSPEYTAKVYAIRSEDELRMAYYSDNFSTTQSAE